MAGAGSPVWSAHVMPALVSGIHAWGAAHVDDWPLILSWMAGTSLAMTVEGGAESAGEDAPLDKE